MKISWFEDHHGYPDDLTTKIDQPDFVYHIQWFLHAQEHPHFDLWASQAATDLPHLDEKITVYPSAVATFFSPSDISGIGGNVLWSYPCSWIMEKRPTSVWLHLAETGPILQDIWSWRLPSPEAKSPPADPQDKRQFGYDSLGTQTNRPQLLRAQKMAVSTLDICRQLDSRIRTSQTLKTPT